MVPTTAPRLLILAAILFAVRAALGYATYTDRGGATTAYTLANAANEYATVNAEAVSYDAAGNLTVDEDGRRYSYDERNRLIEVRKPAPDDTLLASYSYDALGRRVVATIGTVTTRYYYDGQNVIEERDGSDVRVRYHVNGAQFIDERVATFDDATTAFTYYLLKENFSVAGTANADGSTIERLDYSATGSFAGSGGGIDVDYNDDGYVDLDDLAEFEACASGPAIPQNDPNCAGMKLDADADVDQSDFGLFQVCYSGTELALPECTGAGGGLPASGTFVMHGRPVDVLPDGHTLLFVRARFYDLKNGRWLQRDPSGYASGNNLYEGFANNPERFVDPEGQLFQELMNLVLQGRFLSNEEIERAQAAGDFVLTHARSRLLRDVRLAGGALIDPAALARFPQGFEEGYRQPAIKATTARFQSFIYAQMQAGASLDEASSTMLLTALFFGDVTGVTALGEGVFRVDLSTNETLGMGESVRRSVQGGSTIIILTAGPQAMRTAGARSAALRQAAAIEQQAATASATAGANALHARVLANLA